MSRSGRHRVGCAPSLGRRQDRFGNLGVVLSQTRYSQQMPAGAVGLCGQKVSEAEIAANGGA